MLTPRQTNIFCALIVLLAGILILAPQADFQLTLAQGDHGRDLYAFERTLRGEAPYRDYWWVYGPLMPYAYAGWLALVGVSIRHVLWGKLLLDLAAGLGIFAAARRLMRPVWAAAAALWFYVNLPEFFYTYNHAAATCGLAWFAFALFTWTQAPGKASRTGVFAAVFGLMLIKPNIGLAALAVAAAAVVLAPSLRGQKTPAAVTGLLVLAAAGLVYTAFLRGLPLSVIRQCHPYLPVDHPNNMPLPEAMRTYWKGFILGGFARDWSVAAFRVIALAAGGTLVVRRARAGANRGKAGLWPALPLLTLAWLVFMHEYFLSGILYRVEWAAPFLLLACFLLLDRATAGLRAATAVTLVVLAGLMAVQTAADRQYVTAFKKPSQFIAHPKAQVYVSNPADWIETVNAATDYLNTHLQPGQTFFAAPYDPLYYYLTGRPSPTRQLIFFEHIRLTPAQEQAVIEALKDPAVRFVLLSNRTDVETPGFGTFGRTHGRRLSGYINEHFEETVRFGRWEGSGWIYPHGVRILKRIE